MVLVGVDAQIAGDGQRLLDDLRRGKLGVLEQRACRGLRVCATRTDRDDAMLRLEHVARAGDHQRRTRVGHREHRLQPAQDAVGAPVLCQFHRSALKLTLMFVELRFEALEQRECVGGRAGETCEHSIAVKPAHLAGCCLDDDVAKRHLAIAAERDGRSAPH